MTSKRLFTLPAASEANLGSLQQSAAGSYITKYLNAHFAKIANLKKDLPRLPEEGETFFLQSDKQYNAFTFIPWIIKHETVKHLYVTTYSINKRVIASLIELHTNGDIDAITLLVSDTMLSRNRLVSDLLASIANTHPNITVLFAWVHAKVALVKTEYNHYVIEGSGNWSENAHYEQYIVCNEKNVFSFRMKLITDVEIRHRALNGVNVKV